MKKFNFEKFGFYRNIFFIVFFVLFLCFLLFTTTLGVHAQGTSLPYVVDGSDLEVPFEYFPTYFNGHPHQTNNTVAITEDGPLILTLPG